MVKEDYIDIQRTAEFRTRILLPASKSISNRALIINALSRSSRMPENLSDCDDTRVMLEALQIKPDVIDVGAAGTAMRFLTAYLSVNEGTHIITGSERMRQRPIGILVDALRQLGAKVEYLGIEGFPPLRITGNPRMLGGELELSGNVSSQYISALLMIAPTMAKGLKLTITGGVVSRPYIDMTVSMMRQFGAHVEWIRSASLAGEAEGTDSVPNVLRVLPISYSSCTYMIENDWSAASYWYEMVALSRSNSVVMLPGLYADSLQGDSEVRMIFSELGVETRYVKETDGTIEVHLRKNERIVKQFNADFTNVPDLTQTVVVTCAMLNIPFNIKGLRTLRIKETDRIQALVDELAKFGFKLIATDDSLSWYGLRERKSNSLPIIETYEDHRMAMAFAPTCMRKHIVRILNPQVVSKSYPHYWSDMEKAGFIVKMGSL